MTKSKEHQCNDDMIQTEHRKRVQATSGRGPDALAPNDVELSDGSIQTQADRFRNIMERNKWPHTAEKLAEALRGGLADGLTNRDFNAAALAAGTAVEREHTTDKAKAQEIARDHLKEDPRYYQKLKKIEKAAGYETDGVAKANQVGRKVLPAWSTSIKTPAGARRAAAMVSQQPYAPGGAKSMTPAASSTSRKPLSTMPNINSRKPLSTMPNIKTAALLDAFIDRLEKEAGITDWSKKQFGKAKRIKPSSVAKGVAGLGMDIATFGVGEGIANKIIPRWQPKLASIHKEAIGPFALLMAAPLAFDAAKAVGRLSKKPGAAISKGLGPKVRSANTPEVRKVAFWFRAAKLTAKYVPKILSSLGAKKTALKAANVTAGGLKAGAGRVARRAAGDVALGAGLMGASNALSHVGRPQQSETPQ